MVTVSDYLSCLLWQQAVRVAIYTFVEVILSECQEGRFIAIGFPGFCGCQEVHQRRQGTHAA